MNTTPRALVSALALLVAVCTHLAGAQTPRPIVLASTTSTEQSGLFAHLLPAFTQATGIAVKVVAVGTGQAIDMGRRGDADVMLVHDPVAEDKAVAEGFASERRAVMYNDFVLIGPSGDPAQVAGHGITQAFRQVASSTAGFISRGDKSGTHAAELRQWQQAGLASPHFGGYKACGCGMGQALNMAAATNAYVLSDRGTWLNFKNRGELRILVEGDQQLFNPYGVLPVNPARHPHVNAAGARRFVDWITSPAGQQVIGSYNINGEALFFPIASKR